MVLLRMRVRRGCFQGIKDYPRRHEEGRTAGTDPELKRRIQALIDYKGGGYNEESVADIVENALKLLTDLKDSGDVRVIQTALRELRYAFKMFAPYAQRAQGDHVRFRADGSRPGRSTSRRSSSAGRSRRPGSW